MSLAFSVFHFRTDEIPLKKNNGQFSAPYTTTITYNKSMNTVNYLWVAICSKCSQFPPTA